MKTGRAIKEMEIYRANSFAWGSYRGNPAGVCLLPEAREDEFYRKAAIIMDCPETAFLAGRGGAFDLRWFTRGGFEVDLCGHATLAAGYILRATRYAGAAETIRFQTKSGILTAEPNGEYVSLGFPLEKVTEINNVQCDFKKLLGLTPVFTGRTRFDYLVQVESDKAVINLAPDYENLKKIKTRGIIVTAWSSDPEYDFVSRFFAPSIGIDEDPVTGSAHCALGPYWGAVLNKNELTGYQASREGGVVRVEVLKEKVRLSGAVREAPVPDAVRKAIFSY